MSVFLVGRGGELCFSLVLVPAAHSVMDIVDQAQRGIEPLAALAMGYVIDV